MMALNELWRQLDELRFTEFPGFTDPWKDPNPNVQNVWNQITNPENLNELKQRLNQPLNFYAKKATQRAYEECQKKARNDSSLLKNILDFIRANDNQVDAEDVSKFFKIPLVEAIRLTDELMSTKKIFPIK